MLLKNDFGMIPCAIYGSNTVTKLRATDGTVLAIVPVGTLPWNVAFDGANVWVTSLSTVLSKR